MLASDTLPTTLALGYRVTDGRPLTDTGINVTYDGPAPDVSLCLSPDSISLMEKKNGDHWIVVFTVPWNAADSMPDGFFGLITNGIIVSPMSPGQ
jgi:hypothetical protein